MAENGKFACILRITSEDSERRLFVRRSLYVGLKRAWSKGSRILFAGKFDAFLGSGVVERVQQLEELDENEKALCLQKNWSAKLHFATLTRFSPPVAINVTPVASQNQITLHGSEVDESVASNIEELAITKIIT